MIITIAYHALLKSLVSYRPFSYGFPSVVAPAFSTPVTYSRIFHSCIFSAPVYISRQESSTLLSLTRKQKSIQMFSFVGRNDAVNATSAVSFTCAGLYALFDRCAIYRLFALTCYTCNLNGQYTEINLFYFSFILDCATGLRLAHSNARSVAAWFSFYMKSKAHANFCSGLTLLRILEFTASSDVTTSFSRLEMGQPPQTLLHLMSSTPRTVLPYSPPTSLLTL